MPTGRDATAPEEVLAVVHAYHQALGSLIFEFEGTVGPLVEDRLTVLFNDPLPTDDPAGQAVRLALAMRERMVALLQEWRKIGHVLDFGVGIDLGYATLGSFGFDGKTEYGAIGTVGRLAARLIGEGMIMISNDESWDGSARHTHTPPAGKLSPARPAPQW
jgi:class 3 adenylate cyclase